MWHGFYTWLLPCYVRGDCRGVGGGIGGDNCRGVGGVGIWGVIIAVATGGLLSGSTLKREKRHMGREKLMGGMKNST